MFRVLLILILTVSPCFAVEPDEILADPVLESRARALSKEVRCLVCRNENIDSSNADLARDLRVLVRERLVSGDTDQEVLSYLVARYGDYVLLRPPVSAQTFLLWSAGGVLLLLGSGVVASLYRRKPEANSLSDLETARLNEILVDKDLS